MKKAKIVASLVLAAAVSATSLAAACSFGGDGGKKFKLDNYAHALDSAYSVNFRDDFADKNVKPGFSLPVSKFNSYTEMEPVGGNFVKAKEKINSNSTTTTATYTFYDVKNSEALFNGLAEITPRSVGKFNYYQLVKRTNSGTYEYRYVGPDGKPLVSQTFTEQSTSDLTHTFDVQSCGVNDDDETKVVYYFKVEYTYVSGTGATAKVNEGEKYFGYSVDKQGDFTWEEATESEAVDNEYKAGTQLGPEKIKLGHPEVFPSKWDNIEYTVESSPYSDFSTYTFYKDGELSSSVTVEDNDAVFFVGKYMYWYSVVPVSADATEGYNYVEEVSLLGEIGVEKKENHTLYRYNFLKGAKSAEEVETDYILADADFDAMYNYADGAFDRLPVVAYKKVDGVAVVNDSAKTYNLILDDNFKVSADISGRDIADPTVYKLKEDRYLSFGFSNSYILDGDMNVVAKLPGEGTVWAKEKLIRCGNGMFVDFDGKVVIEPNGGTTVFDGEIYSDGKVYSKAEPAGIKVEEIITVNAKNGDTVEYHSGVLVKVMTSTGTNATSYTLGFFTLDGVSIGSISNLALPNVTYNTVGGKLIISGTVRNTSGTTTTVESACWIIA